MKSKKYVGVICLALVALLIVATAGLFIYQTWQNGWQIEGDTLAKFGLVLAGLVLTMIKLVSKVGNSLSPRKYESMYRREIGAAFSAPDKRGAKRALIKAIAHYNESKYNSAISILESLRKACNTKADHDAVMLFLALCYTDAGGIDDAIVTYEEMLKFSPDNSTAWSNLGLLYRQKRKE